MKNKFFIHISILIFVFSSSTNFCQKKISYGVKGGISIWKHIYIDDPGFTDSQVDSYPPGIYIGFFTETTIAEKFSVVNELSYQNRISKHSIYTGYEGIPEQKITTKFIDLSALLKYQSIILWNTYFILGPNFSYLLKANYDFYDQIYLDKGNIDITNDLHVISASINLGFGKNIRTSNFDIIPELRAQLGISKFENSMHIGTWRNLGLIFLVGIQI